MRVAYIFAAFFLIGILSSNAQSLQPPPPRPFPLQTPPATAQPVAVKPQTASAATAQPNPPFVMQAPNVREKDVRKTGYSLGAWIGMNPIQEGEWKINRNEMDEKNSMWLGGGLKLGYTWPFNDEPILQFSDEVGGEGLRLSGGLETEAFGIGSRLKLNDGTANRKLDLDSAVCMLNFFLKGQAGDFRPYVGPGLGFAAVFGHDYDVPGRSGNDDEAVVFAFQVLAGCDYFVDRDWSIFGEYRFLQFYDLELYNRPVEFQADPLNQHIFAMGVRYHF